MLRFLTQSIFTLTIVFFLATISQAELVVDNFSEASGAGNILRSSSFPTSNLLGDKDLILVERTTISPQ